jgi:transposase InsO family protein
MRGRKPAGPESVEQVPGSDEAKKRARTLLETVAGTCRVLEACDRLDISEPRYHQLKTHMLETIVAGLEPGKPGRPAQKPSPEEQRIAALQQQVAELELKLQAAQARTEIALVLPNVVQEPTEPEKKNAPAGEQTPAQASAQPSPWAEEEHVKRLQELSGQRPTCYTSRRRGFARQMAQRQREQVLRSHLVVFSDSTSEIGWTLQETAELLKLSPRTLRQWQGDCRRAAMQVLALGRPCQRSSPQQRNEVIGLLDELGPALGVPTLEDCFPGMPRAELADIVHRYRRVWRKRHHQALRILHWQVPGSVWAADFAEAPGPIDGLYPYLLAVRDLASGNQLLWLPVEHPDSSEVVRALASLVAYYGAPLVLKTDNGSPFCAGPLRDFLRQALILPLFSPPYMPEYNGAAEAGIRSLKTRTENHASRQGHPAYWTFDNAAFARAEANATAHPHGPSGPTPDQAWTNRPTITAQQRSDFQAGVNRGRDDYRAQEHLPKEGPLTDRQERAQDRQAIPRALEELGYLLYSRRRLPLPFTRNKGATIT